jgi:hypothetical protein
MVQKIVRTWMPKMSKMAPASLFVVNISPFFEESTAPLRHILPIHNVIINSNNLFVNFRWTFTFALRNLMTERTSHLVGLWIGAAILNMSHSNKAGSTTVKRARLKVKDQVRRQCCHNKHKKFHIGLHVMYLSFPDTTRDT